MCKLLHSFADVFPTKTSSTKIKESMTTREPIDTEESSVTRESTKPEGAMKRKEAMKREETTKPAESTKLGKELTKLGEELTKPGEELTKPGEESTTPKSELVFSPFFKGKSDQIKDQIDEFWEKEHSKEMVQAHWDGSESDIAFPDEKERRRWTESVFRDPKPLGSSRFLYKDEYCTFLSNLQSFHTAQYRKGEKASAGMSALHLFGLARIPIFNGVDLHGGNCGILDHIKRKFIYLWLHDNEFRTKVKKHIKDGVDERYKKVKQLIKEGDKRYDDLQNESAYEQAKKDFEELAQDIERLAIGDFAIGLHLYPDQSVYDIHFHFIAVPEGMRAHSTRENDEKTKDAEEVVKICRTKPDLVLPFRREYPAQLRG